MKELIPDLGYGAPYYGPKCDNPAFADQQYHKIGLFIGEHLGSEGDEDPTGLPGHRVYHRCVRCMKIFRTSFLPDNKEKK